MKSIITGTAESYVKAKQMRSMWAMKKKGMTLTDISNSRFGVQAPGADTKKADKIVQLKTKLKTGMRLTGDELEYLRREAPEMYQKVVDIEAKRNAYKSKLKNCKTKDEVQEAQLMDAAQKAAEVQSIANNPHIPEGKKLELAEGILMENSAIQQEHAAFVSSGEYDRLQTRDEIRLEEVKAEEEAKDAIEDAEKVDPEPTEPVKPEQTEPAEPVKPEQTEPADPTDPVKPEQADQTETTDPVKAVKPVKVEPTQSQVAARVEVVKIEGVTYSPAKVAATVARMSGKAAVEAAPRVSSAVASSPAPTERAAADPTVAVARAKRRYLGG